MPEWMMALLGGFSLIVTAIVYLVYIPSIFKGRTQPHIFSWFIYTVITTMIFIIQVQAGAGAGSWATGATAAACLIIFILSFRHGTRDITRDDVVALGLSITAIIAWVITDTPLYSLLFVLTAEVLGFYPTFRKTYVAPYSEPLTAYLLSALKYVFAIPATQDYNFYTMTGPVFYLVTYLAFVVLIYYRRKVVLPPSL